MQAISKIYTLNSTYNEKKYVEILLHYRQLFVKGHVIIGEWGIFGVEIFLHYSQFFIKGDFIIGGVECKYIKEEGRNEGKISMVRTR